MSPKAKPAIVLVHGGWHVPEHYSDFIKQLQRAEFEVFCPLLPTCDETKRLKADMFDDVEVVRSQVISLLNKSCEVIMLLHSYGGAVGTEAVKICHRESVPQMGSTAASYISSICVALCYKLVRALAVQAFRALSTNLLKVPRIQGPHSFANLQSNFLR